MNGVVYRLTTREKPITLPKEVHHKQEKINSVTNCNTLLTIRKDRQNYQLHYSTLTGEGEQHCKL